MHYKFRNFAFPFIPFGNKLTFVAKTHLYKWQLSLQKHFSVVGIRYFY